jgi:hypothetical protein
VPLEPADTQSAEPIGEALVGARGTLSTPGPARQTAYSLTGAPGFQRVWGSIELAMTRSL